MAKPAAAVVMDGEKKSSKFHIIIIIIIIKFYISLCYFGFVWLLLLNRTIVFDLFNS